MKWNWKTLSIALASVAACAAMIAGLSVFIHPKTSANVAGSDFGVSAASQSDDDSIEPDDAIVAPVDFTPKEGDTTAGFDDSATKITLGGASASVNGSGATVSGGIVTISKEGAYFISGTLNNGQIYITANKNSEVRIVLSGADITNKTGAPIYAEKAGKLIVTLAAGSENRLVDGGSSYKYKNIEKEEPNAALFAKNDLTINGTGALTVSAGFNNGIGCKDNLLISGGIITVNAANNALNGSDSVTIADGFFNLTSQNDGIKTKDAAEADSPILIQGGSFNIAAAHDGIQSGGSLTITGGDFNITSGSGYPGKSVKSSDSRKGIKAETAIRIKGGAFTISSYDDGIHCNGDITIDGGIYAIESGDDGIHGDGTVTVNNGTINVKNSYEGIEGELVIFTGGDVVVHATDDGVNAATKKSGVTPTVTIAAGKLTVYAQSDGIDANGNIVITGGTTAVFINAPRDGDPIDIDRTANILPALFGINVSISAGAKVEIDGIWSGTAENAATSFCLCVPGLVNGQSYTLKANGAALTALTATTTVQAAMMGGGRGGNTGGNQGGRPGGRR